MSVQTDYYIPQMKIKDETISQMAAEITKLRAERDAARKALTTIRDTPTSKSAPVDKFGEMTSGSSYGPGWAAWHFQNVARNALSIIATEGGTDA
jgi:hypothetical protein